MACVAVEGCLAVGVTVDVEVGDTVKLALRPWSPPGEGGPPPASALAETTSSAMTTTNTAVGK